MSASEHINPDQMVKIYHMSWSNTPPHELEPDTKGLHVYSPGRNIHPDILHMGTRRSAISINRTHLHEYEIDQSEIEPITYGDEGWLLEKHARQPDSYFPRKFREAMEGKQQGLWENVPADPLESVHNSKVIPYRNTTEDAGSISYMVPKSAITTGRVRYKGVTDVTKGGMRQKIENEEGLYK